MNCLYLRADLSRLIFKSDELGLEIAQIALPAALALAADPIASLIDTAFIGQIGIVFCPTFLQIHGQHFYLSFFPPLFIEKMFPGHESL